MTHISHRLIDRHEPRQLVPYSDVHVLRLERAGRFPKRIKLGPNRVGWLLSEILAWIEQRRIESHEQACIRALAVTASAHGGRQ